MKAFPENPSYLVSEDGKIFDKRKNEFMKLKNHLGYRFVRMNSFYTPERFYKTKNWLIHRVVAITFIPNLDNLPAVNHIDGNKSNNNVSNLEWITIGDNVRHYFRDIKPKHEPGSASKKLKIKKKSNYDPRARRIYLTLPPVA